MQGCLLLLATAIWDAYQFGSRPSHSGQSFDFFWNRMDEDKNYLKAWDYVVIGAMLCVSSFIGLYYRLTGGRQKTANEYLLGDRKMHSVPVAFSLMASFMSAISLLGGSREAYSFGTQFIQINAAYVLATPAVTHIFLPVFFRIQGPSASVYSYLELRFGYWARLAASLTFSLQMMLYMGIVVYAPALALSAVTGLSFLASVLSVGSVCTFYSAIGGLKAVLITDAFQSVLMFAAIILIIVMGSYEAGGLPEALWRSFQGGRISFGATSLDPTVRHTVWTQLIGGSFVYLSIYGVNQAQVQRLLSVDSLQTARKSLWLQLPILCSLSILTCISGLVMYSHYQGCDPKLDGRISSYDQLMPLFVVETMGTKPGLAGLFVAGIFSGSLSTVSSAINSLSAVTLEDYLIPAVSSLCSPETSSRLEAQSHTVLKVLALMFGALSVALSLMVKALGTGLLQASLSVFGLVGGPLLGIFTLGMFFRCANQAGALVGLSSALGLSLWIGFGQPRPPVQSLRVSTSFGCAASTNHSEHFEFWNSTTASPILAASGETAPEEVEQTYFYLYRISYAWFAVIGFALSVTIGALFSIICKARYRGQPEPHPDLFADPIRKRMLEQELSVDEDIPCQTH